jgi:hypothetical protein
LPANKTKCQLLHPRNTNAKACPQAKLNANPQDTHIHQGKEITQAFSSENFFFFFFEGGVGEIDHEGHKAAANLIKEIVNTCQTSTGFKSQDVHQSQGLRGPSV